MLRTATCSAATVATALVTHAANQRRIQGDVGQTVLAQAVAVHQIKGPYARRDKRDLSARTRWSATTAFLSATAPPKAMARAHAQRL